MRSYDEFFRQVRLDVPTIGLPIVRQAIGDAIREFCKKTMIWQIQDKFLTLAPNQRDYKLALPENSRLQDVIAFARRIENRDPDIYADRYSFKMTKTDMDYISNNWRDSTNPRAEFTNWGICEDREHVFIASVPEIAYPNGVKYTAVLYPSQEAFETIDLIYQEYAEVIGAGAAALLLSIPNTPWFNERASAQRELKFKRGISKAWRLTNTSDNRTKFRRLGS